MNAREYRPAPPNPPEAVRVQGMNAFRGGTPRDGNPFPEGTMQHTQFQVGWDQACLLAGGPEKQPKSQGRPAGKGKG